MERRAELWEYSRKKSLEISAIFAETKNYPHHVQVGMMSLLRKLIASGDNDWLEYIKAEESRIALMGMASEESQSKKIVCLNVATDTMLILLRKAGISAYADNTKMAELISLLTGYSKDKIRQRLSDSSPLSYRHKAEADKAGAVLASLGIEEGLSVSNR
jgi:hypothetical protein